MRKSPIYTALILLFSFLTVSCITVPGAQLEAVDTGKAEIDEFLSYEWQTEENEDAEVVMKSGPVRWGTGILIGGIRNKGPETLPFRESQIEIYGGDRTKNEWYRLQNWDADTYGRNAMMRALGMGAGFSILTLNPFPLFMSFDNVKVMDEDAGRLLMLRNEPWARSNVNNLYNVKKDSPSWVRDHALTDRDIPGYMERSGAFFFKAGKYPNYVVRYTSSSGAEPLEFMYERNDADVMRNPWKDNPYRFRMSVLFDYGFPNNDMGAMVAFSHPIPGGLGAFIRVKGVNAVLFGKTNDDYATLDEHGEMIYPGVPAPPDVDRDWGEIAEFDPVGKPMPAGLTMSVGPTVKVAPHTWLMAGFDWMLVSERLQKGYITYVSPVTGETVRYPGDVYGRFNQQMDFGIMAGAHFITNMLDFSITGSYDFVYGTWSVDLGAGFSWYVEGD